MELCVSVEELTKPNLLDIFHLQQHRHEIAKSQSSKSCLTSYP
jgi:hypothetical protein